MSPSAGRSHPLEQSEGRGRARSARNPVRRDQPYAFLAEVEPDGTGAPVPLWTVFLTNRECPWRCVMCDLWKNTLEDSLEPGLIPAQMDLAFAELAAAGGPRPRQLKLYNSGSFFDPQAIPPEDYSAIIRRAGLFERLIVECHPRLVNERVRPFLRQLQDATPSPNGSPLTLEVALGLETAHPGALERLRKGMSVQDFERAAHFLREAGVAIRVFLLLHPPFIPSEDRSHWLRKSILTARQAGASVVSLIPLRVTQQALEQLAAQGMATEPSLIEIETEFEQSLELGGLRVFLDLWDLDRFSRCPHCLPARRTRLETMNLQQRVLPRITCEVCATT